MSNGGGLEPAIGVTQWNGRSPVLDCQKCWPTFGYGYRPTRRGKKKWEANDRLTIHDVKGPCFTCAGTGLVAIPIVEVVQDQDYWNMDDVKDWMNDR